MGKQRRSSARVRRMADRSLGRRRKTNFKEPTATRRQESVAMLKETAKTISRADHGDSFVSKKEGNLIASVYLRQALDEITEESDD